MEKIIISVLVVWSFCKRGKIEGQTTIVLFPVPFQCQFIGMTGMEFICAALAQLALSLLPFPPLTL